ncbi:unnamed protein product [Porites lobata]|uniref:Uncharacterized protein n=1 Tax=Porites lobata TaxID=104759 RepID=A0ABN8S149_9CNID|nr:unnamed protein product [Porites lobata]
MADCWKEEPRSRPSFYQLIEKLEVIMERDAPYLHLNEHNEDRPYYNVPPEANVFSSYACNSLNHRGIKHHLGDIGEAGCLAVNPEILLHDCKVISRFSQLFVGDKDNIIPFYLRTVYSHNVQLSALLIFLFLKREMLISLFFLFTSGKLSDLQLEGVLYAIAGIVLDNFARGRSRHIWFSISADLRLDAQRDLHDIGCFVKVIDGCQQLDKETRVFGLPADFKESVVFSTYTTLVSSVQKGANRQSRLQQLIDWCGGEQFNGCLIFDECHKVKHFVPGKEESSAKVALAVTTIQRMLPKARVVYCSATGVTDVKNMAFMERLGLWGDGTAFKSFDSFLASITKRGLGKWHSFQPRLRAVSLELKKSLEFAIGRTTSSTPRVWSVFWSCHQRFFKQLCMSMKVPTIVEEAQQALRAGYCVVIGLQSTGEASLESEISRCGGILNGFVSSTEEIISRFITQYFPTQIIKSNGDVVEDQWSVQAKNLQGFVKKINLPVSPLDDLINQLGGPGKVAEMTGRRGRVVKTDKQPQPHYEARESDSSNVDSLNIQERNSFMNGTKLVAIISDAASTGISLHADLRAANQCRRVHVTIELPWSADKAVQQLGRSHRSNQTSGPIYKLVTTNLGGERRFAAAVARRLQ